MVQKAKIKFLSWVSILTSFFVSYLIYPIKNKAIPPQKESLDIQLIRPVKSADAEAQPAKTREKAHGGNTVTPTGNFGLTPTSNFGVTPTSNFGVSPTGNFGLTPSNIKDIQILNLTRTNGAAIPLLRNIDLNAFETWLSLKGIQPQDLSKEAIESVYTEFRLEQISNQLDRIENLLNNK